MGLSFRRNRRRGRPAGAATSTERREYCWQLRACPEAQRSACVAYFRGVNCWDLWSLYSPAAKGCCLKSESCERCSLAGAHYGRGLAVYLDVDQLLGAGPPAAEREVRPVCVYLAQHYLIDGHLVVREQLPGILARLLGADEDREVFRCLRHDAGLSAAYVAAICATHDFRACPLIDASPPTP